LRIPAKFREESPGRGVTISLKPVGSARLATGGIHTGAVHGGSLEEEGVQKNRISSNIKYNKIERSQLGLRITV